MTEPLKPVFDDPEFSEAVAQFAAERGALSLSDLFLLREALASSRIDRDTDGTYSLDSIEEAMR